MYFVLLIKFSINVIDLFFAQTSKIVINEIVNKLNINIKKVQIHLIVLGIIFISLFNL